MSGRNSRLWIVIGMLPMLILSLVACHPTSTSGSNPGTEHNEPVLSGTLIGDCKAGQSPTENVGLPIGGKAINFTLKDVNGTEVRLSRLLAEKPVLMIFGSFT
jgi:cytochrome oxidase Cu insertion factor (SCO1/SenC/PrrC family)